MQNFKKYKKWQMQISDLNTLTTNFMWRFYSAIKTFDPFLFHFQTLSCTGDFIGVKEMNFGWIFGSFHGDSC